MGKPVPIYGKSANVRHQFFIKTVRADEGLRKTVKWYKDNEWWWKPLKKRLSAESRGFWER